MDPITYSNEAQQMLTAVIRSCMYEKYAELKMLRTYMYNGSTLSRHVSRHLLASRHTSRHLL